MEVTIIVPVSRNRYFNRFFDSLEKLECDLLKTNIIFYVDGDYRLFTLTQQKSYQSKFIRKQVIFRNKGIGSTGSVKHRRKRIADIHNEIKHKIGNCDYVFLLEDDTAIPSYALKKLLENFEKLPNALFHSGIELGRWGFPIIGAWQRIGDKISSVSMQEPGTNLFVNAAGFYCCLMSRETYINHEYKPFGEILGPDVEFGMSHHFQGMVDFGIKCIHLTEKGDLTFDAVKSIELEYTRDSTQKDGWKQKVIQRYIIQQ